MVIKIKLDKDACIGCGACASVCSENWDVVEEDGVFKAKFFNSEVDEPGCNKEAEEVCPVRAIKLVDDE